MMMEFMKKMHEVSSNMLSTFAEAGIEEVVIKSKIFDQIMCAMDRDVRAYAFKDEPCRWTGMDVPKVITFEINVGHGHSIVVRRGSE